MGVPAAYRLRKQAEFSKVRSEGHRVRCGPFVFQCRVPAESSPDAPKLGVIASRRVGNAVKRNYGKRLMREIFRRNRASLPPGSETVIVLRSGFDRFDYAALEERFLRAGEEVREGAKEAPGA